MVFFEGAVSYTELKNMPFPELAMLQKEAQRIAAQRSKK